MFEAVAEVLLRHRGDRRVRLDVEIRDLPRPMRVRAELGAGPGAPVRTTGGRPRASCAGSVPSNCGNLTVMSVDTLEFEEPVAALLKEIDQLGSQPPTPERAAEIARLQTRARQVRQDLFARLTPWQRVLVARHPQRPYLLDYVGAPLARLHRDPRRSALRRRPGDRHRLCRLPRPAGAASSATRRAATPSRRSRATSATRVRRATGRRCGRCRWPRSSAGR